MIKYQQMNILKAGDNLKDWMETTLSERCGIGVEGNDSERLISLEMLLLRFKLRWLLYYDKIAKEFICFNNMNL